MNPFADAVRYFSIFRRHIGRRLYLVFVLTALAGAAEGMGLALLLPLFSVLEVGAKPTSGVAGRVIEIVGHLGLDGSLIGILLLIGGAFLLKGAIQFANMAYQGTLEAHLLRELKSRLFDAYAGMDYLYYVRGDTGHFINVINAQVGQFFASFASFMTFATRTILAVSYLGIAVAVVWQFGLMAIAFGGVLLLFFRALNGRVRELSRQTSRELSHLNKLLVQALQAYKYLASTDQIRNVRVGVMNSVQRIAEQHVRRKLAAAFTSAVTEPISIVFILLILLVQVYFFNQPIAPILVAILLFYRGMNSILSIQVQWQNVLVGAGAVEMVRDELDALRKHRERGGNTVLGPLSKGIEFRGVHFAYDSVHGDALRDVSLAIPARSTVAFVGESGAGKSTLVDLMTLLLKPSRGEIRIDGIDSRDLDLSSWRSQVGYVSQDTVVFDDSIAGNISLQGPAATADPQVFSRVRDAARRANIANFIERLPDGYNTVVGERGVRLSGGQRQRIFIARELFKRPNLLILDEATSALDTESERAVQESIDALRGEMTVVMIAHRLSTVKNVDRLYVLEGGRIIEDGNFEELRNREDSRFRTMAELQML